MSAPYRNIIGERTMNMKVDSLGHNSVDRERKVVWRDRFGWRVWWDSRISWWVTQADSGAGSDKARPITDSDLTQRGPFVAVSELAAG